VLTRAASGEKILRCLLTATREWNSTSLRAAAAARCDVQPRLARLATALRAKTSAVMRKGDMLALARLWGFKCDVWQPRQPRRRKATATAPKRSAAAAALPTQRTGCAAGECGCAGASRASAPAAALPRWGIAPEVFSVEGALALCDSIAAAAEAPAAMLSGPAAHAASECLPLGSRRHLCKRTAAAALCGAEAMSALDDALRRAQEGVLQEGRPGAGEAWQECLLSGLLAAVEAPVDTLCRGLEAGAARCAAWRAEEGASVELHTAAAGAWASEATQALLLGARLMRNLKAMCAHYALEPKDAFLQVAPAALQAARAFTAPAAAALADRAEWVNALAEGEEKETMPRLFDAA